MTGDLIFYTNPRSRGRIVRWMLEEVGQPYETRILEFSRGAKSPEYLAINPMGKVPALKHGDAIVTECAAICAYLADAFPAAGLAPPPTDKRRAPYYRWLFFAAGPVETAVLSKTFKWDVPEGSAGVAGFGTVDRTLDTLEKAVSAAPYICGDMFSAADVYVGSHIAWGMFTRSIDKRPAFIEYAKRVTLRPAAIRAREIEDALIAAGQA